VTKYEHEFRDPIHAFITARGDERRIIDSAPFQRLRNIHQLALTYLVYPGATHKRFEHSLGVMELATQIFDRVTRNDNIHHDVVRDVIPDPDAVRYWRAVLRAAALCHDIGHLPFSHAAEQELLPSGYDHERLTADLILKSELKDAWSKLKPGLLPEDIVKVAIGPKKAKGLQFSSWEALLAEMITGDSFGADRMDYLLRDAYHTGVAYGKFDHHRLIQCLVILPKRDKQTDEPALGLHGNGLEASEGLMIARHFMFKQVYFHPVRRAYDLHLQEFLRVWLKGGKLPTSCSRHLGLSDAEVLAAIRRAAKAPSNAAHKPAWRIDCRKHFKILYTALPGDSARGVLMPGAVIAKEAAEVFGKDNILHDYVPPKTAAPDFPVLWNDGEVHSSLQVSEILKNMPVLSVDSVYCDTAVRDEARKWRNTNKNKLLNLEAAA
jgi:HD superfamily phosphohydrolase